MDVSQIQMRFDIKGIGVPISNILLFDTTNEDVIDGGNKLFLEGISD